MTLLLLLYTWSDLDLPRRLPSCNLRNMPCWLMSWATWSNVSLCVFAVSRRAVRKSPRNSAERCQSARRQQYAETGAPEQLHKGNAVRLPHCALMSGCVDNANAFALQSQHEMTHSFVTVELLCEAACVRSSGLLLQTGIAASVMLAGRRA